MTEDKIYDTDTAVGDEAANAGEHEPAVKAVSESSRYAWLAVCAMVVAIIAWIVAAYNGWLAMAVSVLSIVAAAFALKSRRHVVRNTAITAIIAAAVLLVVVAAFLIVIYLGLKTL